jgi:hypothetical protein
VGVPLSEFRSAILAPTGPRLVPTTGAEDQAREIAPRYGCTLMALTRFQDPEYQFAPEE